MHVQSCSTLCKLSGLQLLDSSVHGILQARMLEQVAISFSRDLPNPKIEPAPPELAGGFFTIEPPGKPGIFFIMYILSQLKKKNPKNKLLSIFFAVGNWQKCQTNSHMPMSEVKRAIWGACVMLGETITTWQNYGCANMKSKSPLIQSQEKHHGVISWWKPWRQEEFPQWRLERLFQTFQVQKQNIDSSALEILESLFNHI